MQSKAEAKKASGIVDSKLVIDLADWREEFESVEPDTTSEDPIIEWAISAGMKPAQIGRFLIWAGERGLLSIDFPGSKLLLMAGGASYASNHIGSVKRKITLENGKEYEGRAYVAPVKDDDGTEDEGQNACDTHIRGAESSVPVQKWLNEKVIESSNPEAVERAVSYLLKQVVGNIWGRFLLIAEHDPAQLVKVADELKDKIDEMVDRLS